MEVANNKWSGALTMTRSCSASDGSVGILAAAAFGGSPSHEEEKSVGRPGGRDGHQGKNHPADPKASFVRPTDQGDKRHSID